MMTRVSDNQLARAKRAFILFVQGLFKYRASGDYRWNENDEETQLYVAADEPISDSIANKIPRVIISLGPCAWSGVSTSQRMEPAYISSQQLFSDLMASSVQFSVSARVQEEADAIALHIFKVLPLFESDLNRSGGLHLIATNAMQLMPASDRGAVIVGSPASEWRISRISLPIYIQIQSQRLEDPVVAAIRTMVFSNLVS